MESKVEHCFVERMETPVNRALLFKEMLMSADLMDVFGERTDWYLEKLQTGLYDVLNDLTQGYLDAVDDANKFLKEQEG